jgi:hypothetical protein
MRCESDCLSRDSSLLIDFKIIGLVIEGSDISYAFSGCRSLTIIYLGTLPKTHTEPITASKLLPSRMGQISVVRISLEDEQFLVYFVS